MKASWPGLLGPSAELPDVAALEFIAVAESHRQLKSLASGFLEGFRRSGEILPAIELLIDRRPANRVHSRRGFWSIHNGELSRRLPLGELASDTERGLILAGACLHETVDELATVATSGLVALKRVLFLGGGPYQPEALLTGLIESVRPVSGHDLANAITQYAVCTAIGEDLLAMRMFWQDEYSLQVFGAPDEITRRFRRSSWTGA